MNLLKNKIFISVFLFFIFFAFAEKADAATSYFSPSSGNFTVGNIFTVNVLVNTEGVAINNAEAIINFPSGFLEIVSFSKSGSIFSLWVEEPKFSNGAGTLSLNGGLPTPGFKGAAGKVLGVVFRVKKAGSASLVFSSAAVRANDGYGTNVFRTGLQASFNLISEEKRLPPPEEKLISVEGQTITITSSTHPDQNKWYPNKNPVFKWEVPAGAQEVILVLSKRANSPPIISYIPPISEKTLTDIEDGVWYMNGRIRTASGLGPITSFKFNVDTVPPRPFTITRVDTDDPTNPRPELLFESQDETSGLDRYEMKIGEGDWFTISPDLAGKPYKLPFQLPGRREVWAKAVDKAGNFTSANAEIITRPARIPGPLIKEVVLPQIKSDKLDVVKEEVEVVVKEVVVKGKVLKEEGTIKVAAVIIDVLKLENSTSFGQISESIKDAEKKLVKTAEIPVDEGGNFEAKIDDLDFGTYIIRTYGKDERGAISDAYSDVVLKVAGESFLAQFAKWIPGAILRGFDNLIKFLSEGWFLIVAGALVASLVVVIVKKAVPFIVDEIRKVRFIASEYKSLGELKKIDSKTKLEIKMLQKDIKDELDLLKKIANHRPLHRDEQYLKNKLNKYHGLIRNLKR